MTISTFGFYRVERGRDFFGESRTAFKRNACALLRDVFGNLFMSPSPMATHKNKTATTIAQGIYADRAFDRLPILADALEEAGCTDAEILTHCRGPGPHVRGCWIVDLILGKS